ncbi:MAG: hypothetical protein R2799_00635 [Crocinitomicaceae bacterium]
MKQLIFTLMCLISVLSFSQNVWINGATIDYYSNKKVKNVEITVFNGDSLLIQSLSKGKFNLKVGAKGLLKIHFHKNGYIDKYFLLNTSDIPKYYLTKKFKIKADVSMAIVDKYMESNTLENAVGYIYFNPKYKEFIWDAEYTKKAQIAMDSRIFPLEEVVSLDSSLNGNQKSLFYQKGINYYTNLRTHPRLWFNESDLKSPSSRLKGQVQTGYLYGAFTYYLINGNMDSLNLLSQKLSIETNYNNLVEAIKDCKRLDTLILNTKYAAIGYWLNLCNYTDTSEIRSYVQIVSTINTISKYFVSIEMNDSELSFYTDFQKVIKAAEKLRQKLMYLRPSEIKIRSSFNKELQNFGKQLREFSRNLGISQDY